MPQMTFSTADKIASSTTTRASTTRSGSSRPGAIRSRRTRPPGSSISRRVSSRASSLNPGGPTGLHALLRRDRDDQWRHTIDLRFGRGRSRASIPCPSRGASPQYDGLRRTRRTMKASGCHSSAPARSSSQPAQSAALRAGDRSVPRRLHRRGGADDSCRDRPRPPLALQHGLPGTPRLLRLLDVEPGRRRRRPMATGRTTRRRERPRAGPASSTPRRRRPRAFRARRGCGIRTSTRARISRGPRRHVGPERQAALRRPPRRALALSVENLTPLERTFRSRRAGPSASVVPGRRFVPAPNPLPNPLPPATATRLRDVVRSRREASRLRRAERYLHRSMPAIESTCAEVNGPPVCPQDGWPHRLRRLQPRSFRPHPHRPRWHD